MQRVAELESSLQVLHSDLDDQNSKRREWKLRAETAESALVCHGHPARSPYPAHVVTNSVQSRNQFVVLLVDGDSFTFRDSYVKSGESGAILAATELLSQVRSFLQRRKVPRLSTDFAIVVHVYASEVGLAKALVDSGTLSDSTELDVFLHGLTQSPLFHFIDCGPSKEHVNAKMLGE